MVSRDEIWDICEKDGVQEFLLDIEKLDRAGTVVGSVTEVTNEIPSKYSDFHDVFSKDNAQKLPEHGPQDHAIDTEGKQPPFGPIYNLSLTELQILREYLDEYLAKRFIVPSTSSAGAPILFVKKKEGGLRLCVDYRGLNAITIKNRYPLSLIMNLLNVLVGAVYFTKLDIRDAYHKIRVRAGDEWTPAFRCRYGQFEYRVMPFGLVNAPASFQAYINEALQECLDDFVVVYLDDILIFSKSMKDHTFHVRLVLEKLWKFSVQVKLSKCLFDQTEIEFLGFIVKRNGISMDSSRVATIIDWPEPKNHRDVQVFLGFANFYRRFINEFSRIVAALTTLLKGGKKGKFDIKFSFTEEARESFRRLKHAFTTAPILLHFDPKRKIQLETDASGVAISAILSQLVESTGQWHPIAF